MLNNPDIMVYHTQKHHFHLGVMNMADNAKVVWDRQRQGWCVKVRVNNQRFYHADYLGIPCGKDKNYPCPVAQQLASAINDRINQNGGTYNHLEFRQAKPLALGNWAERWLKQIRVSPATLHDYKNSVHNHILPIMGNPFIGNINRDMLVSLQNEINRDVKGKKNVFGCLHKMLSDAHKSGYISKMPVWVDWTGDNEEEQKEIEWLDRDIQYEILSHINEHDRWIFLFLFYTGCRVSEARAFPKTEKAIRKDDILIYQTFDRFRALRPVKTKKQRTYPLTNVIQWIFDSCPKYPQPFMFCNAKTGKPYSKNINRDFWNPACKKVMGYVVQLKNATRHSSGFNLLEEGFDLETVSALMGHSTTTVTKQFYTRMPSKLLKKKLDNVQKIKAVC